MSVLLVPDGAHWMSSFTVRNATVSDCTISHGGVWADAQYDIDATSITVTAYVPASLPAGGGPPQGEAPLATGMVNEGISITNNTVWQADGVATAFLFRSTAGYLVAGNRVVWPTANASNRLVHALNSEGTSHSNLCVYGRSETPC